MSFLELYIGAVIMWSVFYMIGRILFEEKNNVSFIKIVFSIIIFSFFLAFLNFINSEILRGIVKVICIYTLFCSFYKIIFNKSFQKIIIASLILYLFLCISEVVIVIIASVLLKSADQTVAILKNSIIMNFLISVFEYIMIVGLKNKLVLLVKNSNIGQKSNVVIILVVLITLALLGFRLPLSKWSLNIEFIITMVILLSFCFVNLIMIKQDSDIQKTTAMYQQLVDYSDITNNLLEEYRVISHEQKNHLLIIRGMLDETNKELVDYVDNLLDKQVGFKYEWIGDLNHLPLSGLKGLINYKLMEMEALGIATDVSISKEVLKTKLNKLSTKQKDNLYSIMGVYLDNAIQAAKDSKKKEISLEVYKEKKNIIIVLANTYKGKIELDKLDNYGYSTKGKNRGVGLYIVKRIIEEETIFTQSRDLFDEYYIQKLVINLYQIKGK